MIDLHCHLLPGVDDGPGSLEDAALLARAQLAAGVTESAATPHVGYNWPLTAELMPTALAELRRYLADHQIPLTVVAGAEIEALYATELSDTNLNLLTLGDGEWLLVEPPTGHTGGTFEMIITELQARGHNVLLAHVERSADIQSDPEILRRLVDAGVLGQLTAAALSGGYGRRTQSFALGLVGAGLVHNISSDAHDTAGRPPGLAEAIDVADLNAYGQWWCRAVPQAVLTGVAIPRPPAPWPPVVAQRRAFSRFLPRRPPNRRLERPLWP